MKFAVIVLCLISLGTATVYEYSTEMKILTPEESSKAIAAENRGTQAKIADHAGRGVPGDNGGNHGDLVYRHRENGDRLLLREVVINQELASVEQDVYWFVSLPGARISSVRALNFGRERAFCLRIDVAGGDAQVILRIPPLYDPRVMIEIYGF